MPHTLMQSGAVIRGAYRYHLWRTWDPAAPQVAFIMCNPSLADEITDDPTLRRCIGFAQTWGFGTLSVVNVFAYRSPSPGELLMVTAPIGPENDVYLLHTAAQSSCLIAAWGCYGAYQGRDRAILELLAPHTSRMFCLGRNRDGSPKHPLYVRRETERQCFL